MGNILSPHKLLSAEAIANGITEYSNSIGFGATLGFNAVLVVLTGGSNVTITQQCSHDNITWYDPVDIDGNALGKVYTNLTASTYIAFTPVMCEYIRFKVTANANSTITLTHIFQERP